MNKAGWSSILFATLVLVFGVAADAQQPAKVPRIGYLANITAEAQSARIEAFRQGLRELGYVRGKTSLSSLDTQKESQIAFPRSRLSWCV